MRTILGTVYSVPHVHTLKTIVSCSLGSKTCRIFNFGLALFEKYFSEKDFVHIFPRTSGNFSVGKVFRTRSSLFRPSEMEFELKVFFNTTNQSFLLNL